MNDRTPSQLPGIIVLSARTWDDPRGAFSELFNARDFAAATGLARTFVQDNWARSVRGTLRGLHYQRRQSQAKLVRVLSGAIYDVALDLRRGSPTFGRWEALTLSAQDPRALYIPEGVAHGYCVLTESADVFYKCTAHYAPAEERGVAWNDPRLAIPWPLAGAKPVLSTRDLALPALCDVRDDDLPEAWDPGDAHAPRAERPR